MVLLGVDLNENAEVLGPKPTFALARPGWISEPPRSSCPLEGSRQKPKTARYLPARGLPPGNVPNVRAFPALREPNGRARRPWGHAAKPLEDVQQSHNQATKTAA